jgi:hypothetical protein
MLSFETLCQRHKFFSNFIKIQEIKSKSVKTREEDLEKQDQTSYMNHYSTVTIWNPRFQCYCSRNDLSCLLGYIGLVLLLQ